jgi:hypothetical protein
VPITLFDAPPATLGTRTVSTASNPLVGGGTSFTIAAPADLAVGDYMLLVVTYNSATSVTGPAGWATVAGPTVSGTCATVIYGQPATFVDLAATYAVTLAAASVYSAALVAVYQVGGQSTLYVETAAQAAESVSQTGHATPSVPVAAAQALLVGVWARSASSATWSPPAGDTELVEVVGAGSARDLAVSVSTPLGPGTYSRTGTTTSATAVATMGLVAVSVQPPGVVLTVEAALSAATGTYGAWDAGLWDTATWGPDEVWADISAFVREFHIDRKFSHEVQSWDPGTATVVLSNRDGRFSSDNLSGPYVVAGVTAIRPERPIRIRATHAGIIYNLYRGYIVDWVDTWVEGHTDAYVTVPCVDEMAALADVDGLEQSPQGAGETSGQRIHRVLNAAGHTGMRNIAVGRVTVQATILAANAATELKLVEDSEGGGLFIGGDGTVVFEDQYALLEQARSNTIQATFGDGTGTELPCSDVTPTNGGDQIKNEVSYARVGGTAQTVTDLTSRALYRLKRKTRTDLVCETDAQALALATFDLEKFKAPAKRISRIEVLPRANPAQLFPQVLGRRMRDLVRVVARPLGSPVVTRDCFVAGVHHQVVEDDWVTTFDLWDATVYRTYANSRWDVARWDESSWFF